MRNQFHCFERRLVLSVAAMLPTAAAADWEWVFETREVNAGATIWETFEPGRFVTAALDEDKQSRPVSYGVWNTRADADASLAGGSAEGSAWLNSGQTTSSITATGGVEGSASNDGAWPRVNGGAEVQLNYQFRSIGDTTVELDFEGTLIEGGSLRVQFALFTIGGLAELLFEQTVAPNGSIDVLSEYQLFDTGPDEYYQLNVQLFAAGVVEGSGNASGSGAFEMSLNTTPTPAGLSILAGVGLFVSRRRR